MDTSHIHTETDRGREPSSGADMAEETKYGDEGISEEVRHGKERISEQAARGKERLKERGAAMMSRLEERGVSMLEDQKQTVCEEIHHYSTALRRAAESLHEDDDERVAAAADRLANELEAASEYLENNRISGIYRDAEEFARRRPEWVFGGLFLAGLAFGRFLKASGKDNLVLDYEGRNGFRETGYTRERNLPAETSLYTPTPAATHAYGESGAASYSGVEFGSESYGGTSTPARPAGDTEE